MNFSIVQKSLKTVALTIFLTLIYPMDTSSYERVSLLYRQHSMFDREFNFVRNMRIKYNDGNGIGFSILTPGVKTNYGKYFPSLMFDYYNYKVKLKPGPSSGIDDDGTSWYYEESSLLNIDKTIDLSRFTAKLNLIDDLLKNSPFDCLDFSLGALYSFSEYPYYIESWENLPWNINAGTDYIDFKLRHEEFGKSKYQLFGVSFDAVFQYVTKLGFFINSGGAIRTYYISHNKPTNFQTEYPSEITAGYAYYVNLGYQYDIQDSHLMTLSLGYQFSNENPDTTIFTKRDGTINYQYHSSNIECESYLVQISTSFSK